MRRGDASVQVSSHSELVSPVNRLPEMSKNPLFPAISIAPATGVLLGTIDVPLASSRHGDPPVPISCQSEFVCPPKSPAKVTSLLFPDASSGFLPIPVDSRTVCSCGAPICNPPVPALQMVHSPLSSAFPLARNFRSTAYGTIPPPALPIFCNSDAVPSPIFNSFGHNVPQVMGHTPVFSISGHPPPIVNAQISGFRPSLAPSSVHLAPSSSDFNGFSTGSGLLSSSPAGSCAPAAGVRVDSAESSGQLGRVNSAVNSSCTVAPGVPPAVSVRYVPPTVSFRDILGPAPSDLPHQRFADVDFSASAEI